MADQLRRKLEKSLKAIILANDNAPLTATDRLFHRTGVIPEDLYTDESRKQRWITLDLSGLDYQNFLEVLELLELDPASEFLSKAERQERLWHLFCDAYLNRKTYTGAKQQEDRIDAFLSDVRRSLRDYEVLIPVEHFTIVDGTLALWDFKLEKITHESLGARGVDVNTCIIEGFFQNRTESTTMIISEKGTSPKHACERARNKAILNLKIMQVYYSYSRTVNEQQLLFQMSEFAIVRDVAASTDVLTSRKTRRIPYGLKASLQTDWLTEKANAHYRVVNNLPVKLKSAFKRAVYWMGASIDEGDPDRKIIALSTALESILCTRSDGRKGEVAAYRMCILCAHADRPWIWPQKVLEIYEVRSAVVHGSQLERATQSDASTMAYVMRDVLDCFVEVVNEHKLKKPADLFRLLETSSKATEFLRFLEERRDDASQQIADALKASMARHSKS